MTRIPRSELRRLRNEVEISALVCELGLPAKSIEGIRRFLCPRCAEFNTATNPRTNLARCFRCAENFNPIELVMAARGCKFLEAVDYLQNCLELRRQNPADFHRR